MPNIQDPQILIVASVLTFVAVIGIGGAILLAKGAIRRRAVRRLSDEPATPVEGGPEKAGAVFKLVAKIGLAVKSGDASPALKSKLAHAGFYRQNAPTVFIGAKIVLLMVGLTTLPLFLLMLSLSAHIEILLSLIVATVLFMVPNVVVSSRRTRILSSLRCCAAGCVRFSGPGAIGRLEHGRRGNVSR